MLLISGENLESVIIYSVEQHLNLAHPSTAMQLKQARARPPRGGEGIAGVPQQDGLWYGLGDGFEAWWREARTACSAFSHPRASGGLSGPELLAGGAAPAVVSPCGAVCSASRAGAVLCQGSSWLQFDERQKTRRPRLYVCVGGWGLSHISNAFV